MRIFRRINSSKHSSDRKNSGKLVHLRGYLFLLQRHLAVKKHGGLATSENRERTWAINWAIIVLPERGTGNRQIQI